MAEFVCPYAEKGQKRCPAWRCDCFIETHPDTPFELHPEDFIVGRAVPFIVNHNEIETEDTPPL